MEVAEVKVLRLSLGVTRMDNIRNESIRTVHVGRFGNKTRGKTEVVWPSSSSSASFPTCTEER